MLWSGFSSQTTLRMSTPAKSEKSAGTPAEVNVTPGFEEKLNQFWERNRRGLIILCAAIFVAILAKGGWDYLAAEKEEGIRKAYASAVTLNQKRSFAQTHAGHELAGVAWLQIADAAYAENKSDDALAAYQESAKILTDGALSVRASLGLAMAQIQSGQAEAGKAALQKIADSVSAPKGFRTEATYHLASLAHAAGDDAQFQQLAQQVMQIDPASPWAQRLMLMQVSKRPAAAVAAPAQPAAAPTAEEPAIKLNLGN